MFSNILVPVDGSNNAYRALEAALFLSEKLESKVTIIHVMEIIPVVHVQSEKVLADVLDSYKKESQLILSKCSELATKKGLSVNSKQIQGDPGTTILDFCKKEKFDTIVMGSRGMGKFKELVLGSVSNKVVHHSLCPVMIVK